MANKQNGENVNVQEQENMGLIVANIAPVVISETDNYTVTQNAEGKFVRKAKYKEFSSVVVNTRAEKMWLLNILEGDEESGNGLKEQVGKTIEVQDIITRPYDKLDEDTGETINGVLTYLITPDKTVYVTSSKTVYFSVTRIMDLFGAPGTEEWENIKLKVGKEKGQNGDIIKVKMVG